MAADTPATRATIRATVTVTVWAVRVVAYVLHGLASALDAAAAYADVARGLTDPKSVKAETQPRLTA